MKQEIPVDFFGRKPILFENEKQVVSPPLSRCALKLCKKRAPRCEKNSGSQPFNLQQYRVVAEALVSPGFDPQADAIVHVDLHLLRLSGGNLPHTRILRIR
jgi:hypothetical protein